MAVYQADGSQALAAAPGNTNIVISGAAANARRFALLEFTAGSEAATPADAMIACLLNRHTADGTGGGAVVPEPLDQADPAATTIGLDAPTVEPTYTAGEVIARFGRHLRATYRWVAAPGAAPINPATNDEGMGLAASHASDVSVDAGMFIFKEM